MISNDVVASYVATSGVRLGPAQVTIRQHINISEQPLFYVEALARSNKTAIAHCVLHAFLAGANVFNGHRRLALFTVPTR
jgi:hypothetical protein